jgi:hypothetical protein
MEEKERPKSALGFMPEIGSGDSAASWTSLMKQMGSESPVVEQEKKIKGMSILEASGV